MRRTTEQVKLPHLKHLQLRTCHLRHHAQLLQLLHSGAAPAIVRRLVLLQSRRIRAGQIGLPVPNLVGRIRSRTKTKREIRSESKRGKRNVNAVEQPGHPRRENSIQCLKLPVRQCAREGNHPLRLQLRLVRRNAPYHHLQSKYPDISTYLAVTLGRIISSYPRTWFHYPSFLGLQVSRSTIADCINTIMSV